MTEAPRPIVVGMDGSPDSRQALRWALNQARCTGAHVEALLVWSDPWALTGPPNLRMAGKERGAHLRKVLEEAVEAAVRAEGADDVKVVQRVVAGNPVETLVNESRAGALLVVGTTGMSGLRRWMLGSVSQHCAQLSRVPVVLVPLPGERGEGKEVAEVAANHGGPE